MDMSKYDAIVIGAGHNGLVTAAYLARAGKRVIILEKRDLVGGATVTEEVVPGFKFSVFSYVVSLLRPEIIEELELPKHGAAASRARRHVHTASRRELSSEMARRRAHATRAPAILEKRRRQLRPVRLAHAPHVARGARVLDDAPAGAELVATRRPSPDSTSSRVTSRGSATPVLRSGTIDDGERRRLPRSLVRVRSAEGDDVGKRDHRDVSEPALSGHRLRAATSLHGGD